jgi:hypothetical protein
VEHLVEQEEVMDLGQRVEMAEMGEEEEEEKVHLEVKLRGATEEMQEY